MKSYIKAKLGIKTVAVRQQVFRGMWNLVMVLVGKKVMAIDWGYGRGWGDWFSVLLANIFISASNCEHSDSCLCFREAGKD